MEDTVKFSVIMPVYGVEKSIEKSLNCILKQTYKNYELILVDDCTKDNSGMICEKYSKEYNNITYIKHDKNKGLSAARNTGIENASGDYILFLDSDDYYECDLLEKIHSSLKINKADVVIYGFLEEYMIDEKNINFIKEHTYTEEFYENIRLRECIIELEQETLYGYAWNKAYKLSKIRNDNLRFENIKHIEDIEFNARYFNDINSLNIIKDPLYHYVQHCGQRLTTKKVDGYFDLQKKRINILIEQSKYWGTYNDKTRKILSILYFRYFISAIQRMMNENKKKLK